MARNHVRFGMACGLSVILATSPILAPPAPSSAKPATSGYQRERVSLALIDAVATDRRNRPVTDLRPDDFTLMVDGHRVPMESVELQRIADPRIVPLPDAQSAETASALPRRFIFFLDALNSARGLHPSVIPAIRRFVKTGLASGDEVMVVGLGQELKIYQELTADSMKSQAGLDAAQADPRLFAGGGSEMQLLRQAAAVSTGG